MPFEFRQPENQRLQTFMGSGNYWLERFMRYFGYLMVAIYVGIAVLFFFFPVFTYMPRHIKVIFGIFFLLYGLFRFARIIQRQRDSN